MSKEEKVYTSWGELEHADLHPKMTTSKTTTKTMSCPKTINIIRDEPRLDVKKMHVCHLSAG